LPGLFKISREYNCRKALKFHVNTTAEKIRKSAGNSIQIPKFATISKFLSIKALTSNSINPTPKKNKQTKLIQHFHHYTKYLFYFDIKTKYNKNTNFRLMISK
jgi:hypothetical protein